MRRGGRRAARNTTAPGGEASWFDRDEAAPERPTFVVDVKGWEGPLDLLLSLSRDQKVDLVHVSILELADQYLAWVAEARRANLELAADYLVMAAWLAYLKSRLLLPEAQEETDQPSGEEMAAALQFRLRRLEAMQDAGAALMGRPHLGRETFARGAPEAAPASTRTVFEVGLYDLLKAYGEQRRRAESRTMHIEPTNLYSVERALARLRAMLGRTPDWQVLARFLPDDLKGGVHSRSALAATFTAALEMVREGQLELSQDTAFGPIRVRGRTPEGPS